MIVHAKQLLVLSSPAFPPLRGPCMPETEYRGSATQQQMRHRLMPDRSSLTLKETATLADIPGIVSPSPEAALPTFLDVGVGAIPHIARTIRRMSFMS